MAPVNGRPTMSAAECLALRRRGLALRSSLLRAQVVGHATELQTALSWIDRVQDTWIWLRQRRPEPMLPMAAVAAVAIVGVWRKPSRLWRWPLRAWSAWKLWQRAARRWA